MRKFCLLIAACCLLTLVAGAQDAGRFNYIDPSTVQIQQLLDAPPATNSPQVVGELAEIHAWEQTRTPKDIERIKREADPMVLPLVFGDVLGKDFTPEKLPETFTLLRRVEADCIAIFKEAKQVQAWERARPYFQDKTVHPVLEGKNLPTTGSYPSGSAVIGTCLGRVLIQLAPTYEEQIRQRSKLIGEDRIIGGVHFRSDVEAGNKLGDYLAGEMFRNQAFKADIEKATREIIPFFRRSESKRN